MRCNLFELKMINENELEMLLSVGCIQVKRTLRGCHILTTIAFSDFAEKFQWHNLTRLYSHRAL